MQQYIKIPSQKLLELAVLEFGGVITNAYFVVESDVLEHIFDKSMANCCRCFEEDISHTPKKGLKIFSVDIVLTFDSTEVFFDTSDCGYIRRAKNLDIQEQY